MFAKVGSFVLSAALLLSGSATVEAAPDSAIPFQYIHNGILVDVRIDNSGPYKFLIDTDTTPSAIDEALAKRLLVQAVGHAGAGSGIGDGKISVYPVRVRNVTIGDVSVQSLYALATDLSALSVLVGTHIDGVLGTSFLNGRVLQINYSCRRISFLSEWPSDSYTVRFRWGSSGGNIIDDLWIGNQRVLGTFDSGNGTAALVTGKGISDLHLEKVARDGKSAVANGYLGQTKATMGEISAVRLGSVNLGSLQTKFVPSLADQFEVNIGNPALESFVVTMDYKHGSLTLSKSGLCPDRP